MEGLCPCGHEPTGSIVLVSELVSYENKFKKLYYTVYKETEKVNQKLGPAWILQIKNVG